MAERAVLLTCEHACNRVPEGLHTLFEDHEELLDSHRGYDAGARELAQELANQFKAPLFCAEVTRLLIDHNRSPHNRNLWSTFSRDLDAADRRSLLEDHYLPFRERVAGWLAKRIEAGDRVLHLSVHTFTPHLDGRQRPTEIGLLYDPAIPAEAELARDWQRQLRQLAPQWRVHRNRPYRGDSDGHQRSYRKLYAAPEYLALELEVNQALLAGGHVRWHALGRSLGAALQKALAADPSLPNSRDL